MIARSRPVALEAQDLAIGYSGAKPLATNLNLRMRAGELVCLLGPNGTGKSTLIRSLCGMQSILGGYLSVKDRPIETIPPRERARLISVVLTEAMPVLFMDGRALVALGRHPYSGPLGGLNRLDNERIDAALDTVNGQDLAARNLAALSDGERQKLAVARALAQDAQVMLLDEPTAYLDLPRRVDLLRTLRDVAHSKGVALLLSTHDLDLALRFGDRIWLLSGDGSFEEGYPESLAFGGAIERCFSDSRIEWDAKTGAFRPHNEPCLRASVRGESPAAHWTRRALERIGFKVVGHYEPAELTVQVEADGPSWTVRSERGPRAQVDSIDAMIDWILDL